MLVCQHEEIKIIELENQVQYKIDT